MERKEILSKLRAGEITEEQADQLLNQVEPPRRGQLYCRVSAKGAVSVYGLQRMPVTLYVEQWERLFEFNDELRKFIKEHDSELKRKERPAG
jgi:hypothetical protein